MPATLKNYYVVSANRPTKFGALIDIIKMKCQNNKTIIFFNTCSSVVYYHALFSRLVDLKVDLNIIFIGFPISMPTWINEAKEKK